MRHFVITLFIGIALASLPDSGLAQSGTCLGLYETLSAKHSDILATTPHDGADFVNKMHGLEDKIFIALEQCKRDPLLFTLMVENQISLGNLQLAYLYARQAHQRRPEIWQTNHALGTTLCMQKDYEQGIPLLEKAAEIAPHRPGLIFNLCSTYVSAGRFTQAIEVCSDLLTMKQHQLQGPAYLLRSAAYQALGESKKARADLNKAKVLGFVIEETESDRMPMEKK